MDKLNLTTKSIIAAAICLVLGLTSGFSTTSEIAGWYQTINKPSWNPPNWIFGPMWTALYILMGLAFARIWHSNHPLKGKALTAFATQFLLNMAWSFIFFNQHAIGTALIEILVLLAAIIYTTYLFGKIDKTAAYMMVPYILWVAFATVLNGTIWGLNG